MRFYLAGVMRGSEVDEGSFVCQNYRTTLKKLIKTHFPKADIIDPLEGCDVDKSNEGTFKENRKIYFEEAAEVMYSDVLISFLPEASMGTAIEMWQAYYHYTYIITISPMKDNWAIKFLSNLVLNDIQSLESLLNTGVIQSLFKTFKREKLTRYSAPPWNRVSK